MNESAQPQFDVRTEEAVRRWPVWLARLANHIIGWTDETCAAGCGYPVTRRFRHPVETIGDAEVVMLLCSVGGDCEWDVMSKWRDRAGVAYSDVRPDIVQMLTLKPETKLVPICFVF